jgi:glutamyl-tRNA synthetase
VGTIREMADAAVYFFRRLQALDAVRDQHYLVGTGVAMDALRERLRGIDWVRPAIGEAIKITATERGWKMPRVAMPLRAMVTGEVQTPAIDAVLELLGREETLARMDAERLRVPD